MLIDGKEIVLKFDDNKLINVQVDEILYEVTSTSLQFNIKIYDTLNFIVKKKKGIGTDLIPDIINWKQEFNGKIWEWEGFNYIFFPTEAGNYKLSYQGVTVNVKVEGRSVNYVSSFSELKASIQAKHEVTVVTKDIVFNERLYISNIVMGKTGNEKLTYTGPNLDNGKSLKIITLLDGGKIRKLNVLNKGYSQTNRDVTASLFHCAGNNVIDMVSGDGIRHFANLENCPKNIRISNCKVNNLWDYFVWMGGHNLFIYNNTVPNSRREHCIRGNNYEFVTIVENKLTNLDLRPADQDISKGCIVAQYGEYIYIFNNHCTDGGCGIGPLGEKDGLKYLEHRVKYAVVRRNTVINTALQINHGTEYFRVENNTATIKFLNTQEGYPKERTFKYGIVQGNSKLMNKLENGIEVTVK